MSRQLQCLESLDDVLELLPAWERLHADGLDADPFVAPYWVLAWWRAFAEPEFRMRFLAAWEGRELVGVAPLFIRPSGRSRRDCRELAFWANPFSNRVNLLLSRRDPGAAARALAHGLHELQSEWDVGALGPLVLQDPTTRHFFAALRDVGISAGVEEGYSSPFRSLEGDWEALEQALSGSFRQSIRRKVRKAEGAGAVVELTTSSEKLSDAFDISVDTWQHAEGTGIGSTPAIRSFYEEVVAEAERRGELQLAFLSLDGRPVAFELNLRRAGVVYNLKVGYRSEHRELSAGLVLRYHVLKHAVESGMREFDFLGVAEDYKMRWASDVRVHGDVRLFSPTLYWRGVFLLRHRLRPWLKERAPALAPALRRLRGLTTTRPRDD